MQRTTRLALGLLDGCPRSMLPLRLGAARPPRAGGARPRHLVLEVPRQGVLEGALLMRPLHPHVGLVALHGGSKEAHPGGARARAQVPGKTARRSNGAAPTRTTAPAYGADVAQSAPGPSLERGRPRPQRCIRPQRCTRLRHSSRPKLWEYSSRV